MPEYILSCCSTVDLTKENLEKRNINYVPFHFYLNDKHYYDDLWQSISPTQFYKELTNDASVRTSQINTQEFIDWDDVHDDIYCCDCDKIVGVVYEKQ